MRTPRSSIVTLALVAASFGAGAWWSTHQHGPAEVTLQAAAPTYSCPMHPEYRADRPGDCPMCGMHLERAAAATNAAPHADASAPSGAVNVSTERQQLTGVRIGMPEMVSGPRMLRTTGRVVARENAVQQVVAGASGWIRTTGAATPGMIVHKDEVLATFYAPELIAAEQSYFSMLDTVERSGVTVTATTNQGVIANLQRAANTLRNMGVSDRQLETMKQQRDFTQDIQLMSPIDGVVLKRNVTPGLRFDRGTQFFEIADLSSVWVMADLYSAQAGHVAPGAIAHINAPSRSAAIDARVSRAEPLFDDATRTLKLRLDASNPGGVLKPGMFVDVELPVDLPSGLAVPTDAIIDTGLRKVVFVDRGNGFFDTRDVEIGWRVGELVQIVRGLEPHERIVVSGTFLVDSESRLTSASRAKK
ncbi:MAG: efflux RND transporter periplasmic adaptor subunit [Acidobacteriota bacterium]